MPTFSWKKLYVYQADTRVKVFRSYHTVDREMAVTYAKNILGGTIIRTRAATSGRVIPLLAIT